MSVLHKIIINDFVLENQKKKAQLVLTYQLFGKPLGTAPVVVVNHALTGNSNVAGNKGWWNEIIGDHKVINTQQYTVIAFNIIGNGYLGEQTIEDYTDFTARDMAKIFWKGLEMLTIDRVFAVIGGSLGGGIAWEMAFLRPQAITHLVPIASSYRANDWLIANVNIQDSILNHSTQPIEDARKHAMLLYRTPLALDLKFQQEKVKNRFMVEKWLDYHGDSLKARFSLQAYKLMNHLIKTIGLFTNEEALHTFFNQTTTIIHQIAIDSDGLFVAYENVNLHQRFKNMYPKMELHTITSIHGHDAFLIEYEQLTGVLGTIFKLKQNNKYVEYQN